MRVGDAGLKIPRKHWLLALLLGVPVLGALMASRNVDGIQEPRFTREGVSEIILTVQHDQPPAKTNQDLAMYEPESGCYLGAYIDLSSELPLAFTDSNGKKHRMPRDFESRVQKEHAIYFFYLGYGMPLPNDWVRYLVTQDKFVHIALEPNSGLSQVQEDEYLNKLADDMRNSGARIFLRFASEMNGPWVKYGGNPELYIEKWQLVTRVMRERAPNVAMLWCPYATPVQPMASYYPGDDWVDWVGVNMYSVSYFNQNPGSPAFHVQPRDLLIPVYERWGSKKPIMIAEYATTHYSALEKRSLTDFAIFNIKSLYKQLKSEFPRVKAINYFNTNNLELEHRQNNNYSVTHNDEVLQCYQGAISDPYFMSKQSESSRSGPGQVISHVTPESRLKGYLRFLAYTPVHGPRLRYRFFIDNREQLEGVDPLNGTLTLDTRFYPVKRVELKVVLEDLSGTAVASSTVAVALVH